MIAYRRVLEDIDDEYEILWVMTSATAVALRFNA
jgi:hypothetical protein